jgi:hypothetical protein
MSLPLAKLAGMLPEAQAVRFEANVADASAALAGRAVWNITPARRAPPITAAVAAVSGDHGGLL